MEDVWFPIPVLTIVNSEQGKLENVREFVLSGTRKVREMSRKYYF